MPKLNMVQAINLGLDQEMAKDDTVVILGEDVGVDGGVFRVTDGLLGKYGTERVVVTQLVRSPGAYVMEPKDREKQVFIANLMPARGSWLELEIDKKGKVFVRIDRKRKLPVSVLLRAMGDTLRRVAPGLAPGSIVTDVGSVKGPLCETLPGLLPRGVTYVGSHPMAGSHARGFEHARADLFEGAACIVMSDADPAARARVVAFWNALGAEVLEEDTGSGAWQAISTGRAAAAVLITGLSIPGEWEILKKMVGLTSPPPVVICSNRVGPDILALKKLPKEIHA